jgi:hypothetical protein
MTVHELVAAFDQTQAHELLASFALGEDRHIGT